MTVFRSLVFLLLAGVMASGMAATPTSSEQFLKKLRSDLFLHHSESALQALDQIRSDMEGYSDDANQNRLISARQSFAALIIHWKALEAVYIAGVLNEDLIDHPRFIDHYHQGHVSIEETLKPVFESNRNLTNAMFKSSSKSVNALEYLLFDESTRNARRWQAALISVAFVRGWLEEICQFYLNDKSFVSGGDKSLSLLVNALVDSSYRLLNWRLAEPAGLVPKYRGKPSHTRLEYHRSGLSLLAVQSILDTHARVFSIGAETGYLSTTGRDQGIEEIEFVRGLIGKAQAALPQLPDNQVADVISAEFKEIHDRVGALHKAYYLLLIDAMGFTGKIVDADGD